MEWMKVGCIEKVKYIVFDHPQVVNCFKIKSDETIIWFGFLQGAFHRTQPHSHAQKLTGFGCSMSKRNN